MKTLIITALLLSAVAIDARSEIDPLDDAVLGLLKGAPNHVLMDDDNRARYLSEVRATSAKYEVPDTLLVAVQFLESSLMSDKIGKLGEIGIMQTSRYNSRNCEMRTRIGQMDCGAAILADAYKQCGTWERALTRYAQRSGRCAPDSERVKRLIKFRVKFWEGLK